jgi:hypothetical protein
MIGIMSDVRLGEMDGRFDTIRRGESELERREN